MPRRAGGAYSARNVPAPAYSPEAENPWTMRRMSRPRALHTKLFCEDTYDFIFLTVKGHQVYEALRELKENQSNIIVTMVNSLDDYDSWENICGKGRRY